ncbi:AAA family ATPase [Gottfriedia solisilvae]|uniref:AAA family ATPase n=1 Tax=Gottfriedia solisilvae TaxID=1516104 RepID=UPI003D2F4D6F
MNLAYLVKSGELKRWIEENISFQEKTSFNSIQELNQSKSFDCIILENDNFESTDIIQLRKSHEDSKIMIFIEQNDEMFNKVCSGYSIQTEPKPSNKEDFEILIKGEWFNINISEYKNVIAIHGTHRQAGTTQIALGLATSLTELNMKNILVIGLNPYNPGMIPNINIQKGHTLDNVYKMIQSGVISEFENLKKYFTKVGTIEYLVGNTNLYDAPSYNGEPIKKIINLVKDHYDQVILDIGSYYDNYLPITGLQHADTHILVATQEFISTYEYKNWKDSVLDKFEFNPTYSHLVINKHASNLTKSAKQVESELNIPILAYIPFFPEYADAEYTNGFIYAFSDKWFNAEINTIAKSIIHSHVHDDVPVEKKQRWKIFGK